MVAVILTCVTLECQLHVLARWLWRGPRSVGQLSLASCALWHTRECRARRASSDRVLHVALDLSLSALTALAAIFSGLAGSWLSNRMAWALGEIFAAGPPGRA
eukprot:5501672-Alexandrium_andersonii.AAC.1